MESCEDRVKVELDSRLEDLRLLYGEIPDDWDKDYCETAEGIGIEIAECSELSELEEAIWTARSEYGLCFDYVAPDTFGDQEEGFFCYQLSTGGPGDEFRFFVNPDLSCHRIEYWFLDWSDGASRRLHGADKELLLDIWAEFEETGTAQIKMDEALETV